MLKLYRIDTAGPHYWAVAEIPEVAIELVEAYERLSGMSEDEIEELDPEAIDCTFGEEMRMAQRTKFVIYGEDDSCSMWFAYMIAREHGEGVLACSEW